MEAKRTGKRFGDENWAKENKNEIVNIKAKGTKRKKTTRPEKERTKEYVKQYKKCVERGTFKERKSCTKGNQHRSMPL